MNSFATSVYTDDSAYESKIKLLNSLEKTEYFTKTAFITNKEKVQTNFFKFVFNINRHASNHAVSSRIGGNIQSHLFSDVKLIKYWHRLECMSEGTVLKEAFNVCKTGNHDWIANISNCLKANGLSYIYTNPSCYSVDFIGNLLNQKWKNSIYKTGITNPGIQLNLISYMVRKNQIIIKVCTWIM